MTSTASSSKTWKVLGQHFDASVIGCRHSHVISFKNALNRTRAPDSQNPQGSLVSSTFQTWCKRLGGDREGQVARSTHRTQGEAHPLQEQYPEQMWSDEHRSVGACAETTPALRPEWYRRCARFEADWPDNMVLFPKV